MKKTRVVSFGALSALLLAFAACDGQDVTGPSSEQTGILAHALVTENNTDAAYMRYEFQEVDCGVAGAAGAGADIGDPVVIVSPITSDIPDGIAALQNNPLDDASWHLFADAFQTLSAGCYDVMATPVTDATGETESEDCGPASRQDVVVNAGQVTEIMLINQCEGVDPGALDVIAALNRDPQVLDVNFEDGSKFQCVGEDEVVCVEADDPDGDPIQISLTTTTANCTVTNVDGVPDPQDQQPITQCWNVNCSVPTQVNLVAIVRDMLWVTGPQLVTFETWYSNNQPDQIGQQSQGQLTLNAYAIDCSGAGGAGGAGASGGAGGAI